MLNIALSYSAHTMKLWALNTSSTSLTVDFLLYQREAKRETRRIMNIDFIANLIEATDVANFRTVATIFLRSIGYSRGFYSDGPYDGGVDYFIHKESGGVETAFQLSTESNWRKKLESEIKKTKANHPGVVSFIFVSKRRIPTSSIQKVNTTLVQKHGLSAVQYDNQAIATEFISKNLVGKLYEILGVEPPPPPPKALTTPKTEAAAALLIFGSESGNFRSEMTLNLILSELRKIEGATEEQLCEKMIEAQDLIETQRPDILRSIRHAASSGKIEAKGNKLYLPEAVRILQDGIKALSAGEFKDLHVAAEAFLKQTKSVTAIPTDRILEDLLQLSVGLWRRVAPHPATQVANDVDQTYTRIHAELSSILGTPSAREVLAGLGAIVAKSDFAKRIAVAELYHSLVRTPSSQLTAALGASKGLLVYFDTTVLIPVLCGLLFDKVDNHGAYSARQLIELLAEHKFSAVAPNKYIEEAAAHLVECCRNHQALLLAGEDLSLSSNAFASHFSQLRKLAGNESLSFDDYISTFGSPPGNRFSDQSDSFYYPTIKKIQGHMAGLLGRYSIEHLELDDRRFDSTFQRISESLIAANLHRPAITIEHDARVVGHLEGPSVEAGFAKVLATWDSMHLRLNPSWDSYCVMNPASVTDVLAVLRSEESSKPLTQLTDYLSMQSEEAIRTSARIWDEIVNIEKGKLADGVLLAKARLFRKDYIESHAESSDFDASAVASLWLKWKSA